MSGSLAGICAYSLVYPIDTIKTLLATNFISSKKGIFGNLHFLIKTHGIRRLYKGLSATCCGIFPYAGLKFFFFNYYRDLLKIKFFDNNSSNPLLNFTAGALAGCSAVSITYPTDLIRRNKQVNSNTQGISYLQIVNEIMKNEGLRGFYKGLQCTYYKLIPSTAIIFMLNEFLKEKLKTK